jgi:hypothetical protein
MASYPTVFLHPVTSVATTAQTTLGTVRDEDGKQYTYVYTASNISANRVVVLASGTTNFTVSPDTVAIVASGTATLPFGVTTQAISASSYFYVQTKGFATVQMTSSGVVTPAQLVVATTSGTCAAYNPATDGAPFIVGRCQSAGIETAFPLSCSAYINL